MNPKRCLAIILSLGHAAFALAQPVPQTPALLVTADNYNRALGGDRGISKVEVSTDDGDTWDAAEITKLGTKLSWSLWSFQWTPDEEGGAKVLVRATDGEGEEQISEYRDQVPDGATGLHRVKARVEKT